MRRPVTYGALALGAGILCAYHGEAGAGVWLIMLTAASALYVHQLICGNNEFIISVMLCAAVFCLGGMLMAASGIEYAASAGEPGEQVEVSGTVIQAESDAGSHKLVLRTEHGNVLVRYYSEDEFLKDSKGKGAVISGIIEKPQERRNPGCFDYSLYLKSCGIRQVVKGESVTVDETASVAYLSYVGKLRQHFENSLLSVMKQERAGLVCAMVFGDKTMMDEDIYNEFQKNGTAHVLAVSGLHTGIVYAAFVFLWRGRTGALFYVVTSLLLLGYMALAEFSPSVVRAACMILIHCAASVMRCRYDLLSAASVTFIMMLIINPFQMFHAGFQLSFLAIASLGVILPYISRFYEGIFLPMIAIQAGMMPYSAYLFNYVSVASVVVNIPVIFMAGILLPVGLCAMALSFINETLFAFAATVLDVGCGVMTWMNRIFYIPGVTSFDVVSPPVWAMGIYYGVLFFLLSETGQLAVLRGELKKIAAVIIAVAIAAAGAGHTLKSPLADADIVFVDVGQGDCIHIKTDSGKNYLIDGGGSSDYDTGLKVLKPYLLKNGVRKIDVAFVTHLHQDHYGGIRALAEDGMIRKLAVYEGEKYSGELPEDMEMMYLGAGDIVELDENVSVTVLSPERMSESEYIEMQESEEDENETSLIMRLDYGDTSVLITGDIDSEGEEALVSKCGNQLDCDIMKVPHHGSRYSSSERFVEAVSPALAVFQVGRNNYGHPSQDALDRYEAAGSMIARNDTDGAVGVCVTEGSMKLVRMIR